MIRARMARSGRENGRNGLLDVADKIAPPSNVS
jgi:hypothetical protein